MKKNLLIVDPDPNTVAFLREKLEAENLQIHTAVGGDEGLKMALEKTFDIIVCALGMPRPHGIDIICELQTRGIATPIIFLSRQPHDLPEVRERLRVLGIEDVLETPIFLNRLYERIEARLDMKIHWSEKRIDERVPIRLDLELTLNDPSESTVILAAKTVDLSLGGLQFEHPLCTVCTGYQKGSVHADCLFAAFSLPRAGRPLTVKIGLDGQEPLNLLARVAHTRIGAEADREFVGVKFESMSPELQGRLRDLIRQVQALGRVTTP